MPLFFFESIKSIFVLISFIDASHNFITVVHRKNKCQMQIQMSIIKWDYASTRTYCIARGNMFNVMWQPGWEGSLGQNGYMCMYGWVPSLFTWNCHNSVNQLYTNIKLKPVFFKGLHVISIWLGPCICWKVQRQVHVWTFHHILPSFLKLCKTEKKTSFRAEPGRNLLACLFPKNDHTSKLSLIGLRP